MSGLFDYGIASRLHRDRAPFDALIMAAVLGADSANLARLQAAFPELTAEARARYEAPGGRLPSEVDPPWACWECGSTFDACTLRIRDAKGACCRTCADTATHGPNQHRWVAHFGAKTVAEVRGTAVTTPGKD